MTTQRDGRPVLRVVGKDEPPPAMTLEQQLVVALMEIMDEHQQRIREWLAWSGEVRDTWRAG